MKAFQAMKKYGSKVVLATGGVFAVQSAAHADILTDVSTAITAAKGDALTVGGYVVAAIAALIVVTLIIGMVRKL
jgi:hypothetical protein